MNKDLKNIHKALQEQGWRLDLRGSGHTMAFPPDLTKQPVLLPGTPGGGRWLPNLIAQLRRSGFTWPWPPQ